MSESTLVTGCLQLLKLCGIMAWRQNSGAIAGKDHLGKKFFMRLAWPGMGDIGGILNDGRYLSVECKRPGNRPTPEQVQFAKDVTTRGGVAMTVYSVDHLIKQLRAIGIVRC